MLSLKDSFKMATGGVLLYKSRSVLTILGIVIGITSVVMVMSIGKSAEGYIIGEIKSLGAQNVFVLPGRQPKGPTDSAGTLINDSLKQKDLDDLAKKSNIPDAVRVTPYVFGSEAVSYESELMEGVMVMGSTDYIKSNFDLDLVEGRFFDNYETEQKAAVVVVGDEVRKELFGNSYPIGEKIKIKDQSLMVVGFLKNKGAGSFVNFNKAVIAPYTIVQQKILGIKYFQRIIVEAKSEEYVSAVVRDIETLIRNNHNIDDPEKDDFWIQTQEGMANSIKTITTILTVLLASMASVSLIVGGVGIMNIMFVSVTERTKEIGLRKALGATNNNILNQFLFEALVFTIGGGLVGIVLGISFSLGASYIAQKFAQINLPYVISVQGIILGVVVSTAIGLIFGIVPAWRAAQKSPVESLRK
ncbi:MAG TPA: ABC transporter permease [Candidatus Paceibacterota bacterium]|nr:ABC transporter permease [Candidatus Paceibacterota bacterium]